ncbi:MAG: hypothetical protein JOZ19_10690 [Rubrobacter sp.]|nr:hypothetical protein [Rubrobacter sp.]
MNAAFRRSGVVQVDKISGLSYMAEVLSKQPPERPAPYQHYQRRRPRCAGHRRAHHRRWRTRRVFARDYPVPKWLPPRPLEPLQPCGYPRRRRPRAVRKDPRARA